MLCVVPIINFVVHYLRIYEHKILSTNKIISVWKNLSGIAIATVNCVIHKIKIILYLPFTFEIEIEIDFNFATYDVFHSVNVLSLKSIPISPVNLSRHFAIEYKICTWNCIIDDKNQTWNIWFDSFNSTLFVQLKITTKNSIGVLSCLCRHCSLHLFVRMQKEKKLLSWFKTFKFH